MRHFARLSLLSLLLLSFAADGRAQTSPQPPALRAAVAEACEAAAGRAGFEPAACALNGFERRHVVRDIFKYSFTLKVGAGTHDVIKVHRVVREKSLGVPHRVERSVFMVHGDIWGFDAAFLGSTLSGSVPRDHSIGIYLAGQGVDVWGIDLRWTQVPADTADFTFMKHWNIGTHVRDIGVGLGVARSVRAATGGGQGKVALLGWSRGGILAYAYAGAETRLPEHARHAGALVPVDIAPKLNPEHEEQRLAACRRYASNKLQLDAGQYHSNLGVLAQTLGLLATAAPGLPSQVPGFVGLTNEQAALLLMTSTHLLFAPNPPVPAYHLNAGEFNVFGLPTGLQYTREAYLYDYLQAGSPYQSFTEQVESEAMMCGDADLPYDDYLGEITVPVLYVGAEGGFGNFGLDTLSRLGGGDVTSKVVQLHPAGSRAVEFGHADLFLADNAKELVWEPIYNWLAAR